MRRWRIAAAEAQQVENDHTMAGGKERHYAAPEVTGGRESVQQHDRLAGTARTGGVVVKANPVDVEKLASHGYRKWDVGCVTLYPTSHLLYPGRDYRSRSRLQLRRTLTATLLHPSLNIGQVLLEHLLLIVRQGALHLIGLFHHELATLRAARVLIEALIPTNRLTLVRVLLDDRVHLGLLLGCERDALHQCRHH